MFLLNKHFLVAGAVLAVLGGVYLSGVSNQKDKQELKELNAHVITREKIDESIKNAPTDFDSAVEWLRSREDN